MAQVKASMYSKHQIDVKCVLVKDCDSMRLMRYGIAGPNTNYFLVLMYIDSKVMKYQFQPMKQRR